MAKMNRKQIEESVRRGEHVAVGPTVLRRDPVTLRPDAGTLGVALASPDPDSPDQFEATVVRTADGRLTRAGMEHAIRSGGSVMIQGTIVSSLEGLPGEVEMARGDQERLNAHTAALDAQIAALSQQRHQAQQAAEDAKALQAAAPTQAEGESRPQAQAQPPSHALPEGVPAHPGQPHAQATGDEGEHGHGRRRR